jgi:UDP-N-acetylglucosamine--N-acetylmuramyl-(pentapeptide) pyrophosphoryl-undecaprenol N-acetylglucosamine transferase
VLVIGGSHGAITLNRSVPAAIALSREQLSMPIHVVHQSGKNEANDVRLAYEKAGIAELVDVVPFIDDVPSVLAQSDLVIQRSGAGAVAEVCAIGRASLLVPYPFAAGNHQVHNARALEEAGAALWVASDNASSENLASHIVRLALDVDLRVRMAEAARKHGRPEAAAAIAKDLLELAEVG